MKRPSRKPAKRKGSPALVPVSERALRMRINRKLAHDGELLHRSKPNTRARLDLGEYYIVGAGGAWPTNIDLEGTARELGVLQGFEKLEDE